MTARSQPAWQTVHDEALRRIQSREWAPGDLIPREEELAEELGHARATVNRALRELAEAGFLERRRKAGTRVALTPERRARVSIPLIRAEVEARGMAHTHALLSRAHLPPPLDIRLALALPQGQRALNVTALHLADGRPFAAEDRWISTAAVPSALHADFIQLSANEWLVRHVAFSHGTLDYSATAADAETATRLGCAPGTPVMVLDRVTHGPAAPVTAVRLTYAPGYRLRLDI